MTIRGRVGPVADKEIPLSAGEKCLLAPEKPPRKIKNVTYISSLTTIWPSLPAAESREAGSGTAAEFGTIQLRAGKRAFLL
jgi:hypothetical protein